MPINRAPFNALVDDTGNGLTGSIWNKAAIASVLLDPIDAMTIYGTFAPLDVSGAGLTFQSGTVGYWAKNNRIVFIWMQVLYPANSSGIPAYIGALPYVPRVPLGGFQGLGIARTWFNNPANGAFQALDLVTGGVKTNADLSGANVIVNSVYLTD